MNWISILMGSVLGIFLGRWLFRKWERRGWVVVVEYEAKLYSAGSSSGQVQVEKIVHKFWLDRKKGLISKSDHATRFLTKKRAEEQAAYLTLSGEWENSSIFRLVEYKVEKFGEGEAYGSTECRGA